MGVPDVVGAQSDCRRAESQWQRQMARNQLSSVGTDSGLEKTAWRGQLHPDGAICEWRLVRGLYCNCWYFGVFPVVISMPSQ